PAAAVLRRAARTTAGAWPDPAPSPGRSRTCRSRSLLRLRADRSLARELATELQALPRQGHFVLQRAHHGIRDECRQLSAWPRLQSRIFCQLCIGIVDDESVDQPRVVLGDAAAVGCEP